MPFVKETFKYLKKSIFALLALAALPAVVLGLFFPFFSTLSFIPVYINTSVAGFSDIFWMIFSKTAIMRVYPLLITFVTLILFCSYFLSVLEKHFKTGKLILHNPFRSINNSILTVLKIIPLALAMGVLLLLLQVSLVSLIRVLATGKIGYPGAFDCIWVIILSVLFFLIAVTIMVFMGVWAVVIQIFGFSFSDAFVEAIRITSRKWFSFIAGFLVPVVILLIPLIILNSLPYNLNLAIIIVNIALYLCIIVYYFAYIMVSVYMLTGLGRRDSRSVVPQNTKFLK